ncbi:hypothetical protein AFLA_012740 [Aspergillus flavus NRRL3357]|nr:hypothetical protein AFLA_012740 [Aspergillus flavus NRRL3357]
MGPTILLEKPTLRNKKRILDQAIRFHGNPRFRYIPSKHGIPFSAATAFASDSTGIGNSCNLRYKLNLSIKATIRDLHEELASDF